VSKPSEIIRASGALRIPFLLVLLSAFSDVCAVPGQPVSGDQATTDSAEQVQQIEETAGPPVSEAEPAGVETEPADVTIYRVRNPENPCDRSLDKYDYEPSWYDHTQLYMNSAFCEPALWFDNFFATDRVFEEVSAGTYVRWRNEFTQDEEEGFSFDMGLNASVELPYFSDRLRLTFESEDVEDEQLQDVAPGTTASNTNTLSLRLDVAESDRSKISVSVTPTPRIRVRYRYTYPFTDTINLRLTQEAQNRKGVNSGRTQVDIEKQIVRGLLFRASTEGQYAENFDGVDWLQAFVLYHRLSRKASLAYELSANGITEPQTKAINYRAGIRFRKNFHRPWLFYEIAPEYTWPTTLDASRENVLIPQRSKWLLFFRLEVHFGNAYERRYSDYN